MPENREGEMDVGKDGSLCEAGPSISGAIVETTKACNLKCSHCCVSAGGQRAEELTTAQLKEVLSGETK